MKKNKGWTQGDIEELEKQGRVKVQGMKITAKPEEYEFRGIGWEDEEKKKNKHGAISAYIDGMRFDSQAEGRYYLKLKRMRDETGEVLYFLRQTRFDLPGNVRYRLDFMVFWANGGVTCVDVKGYETDMFIVKKKLVEALYPVKVEVVKC